MPAVTPESWPPRWLSPGEPSKTDGPHVAEFVQSMCRVTNDSRAGQTGELLVLREWQQALLDRLFSRRPDGRRHYRQALVGMPRKNGKSGLGAAIGLYGLVMEGHGAEVYSCAADRDQARIVFGMAKRMVELEPELSETIKVYRDALEVPTTGSIYRVLSSEAFTKEGLSPTLVVFDEVHAQPSHDLWNVMTLGSAARIDPLVLGITTAGVRTDSSGGDSLAYGLYQHGRRVASGEAEDPTFFFAWWEPSNPTADHREESTWAEANPGYGDLVDPEDFASVVVKTPESEFRMKRCNLFVASETHWLPHGAWDECADETLEPIGQGEEVVLFVDGSYSGDSTGIVAATPQGVIQVIGHWERSHDDPNWRVDIGAVEAAVQAACGRYRVREVAVDPFRWQRSMQSLADAGVPIVEYPTTSPARMVASCAKFYDAVMDQRVRHNGHPALARHLANARVKTDQSGPRIVKDHRGSSRYIDLAVCAVGAYDRATVAPPTPRRSVYEDKDVLILG